MCVHTTREIFTCMVQRVFGAKSKDLQVFLPSGRVKNFRRSVEKFW